MKPPVPALDPDKTKPARPPERARPAPRPAAPARPVGVARLQRAVGNRAVGRLVEAARDGGEAELQPETKPAAAPPSGSAAAAAPRPPTPGQGAAQTRAAAGLLDTLSTGRRLDGPARRRVGAALGPGPGRGQTVQAKRAVGTAGDAFEQEADRLADWVLQAPRPRGAAAPPAERPCPECDDHARRQAALAAARPAMLSARGAMIGGQGSPDIESFLDNSRGSGQPLPQDDRAFMEARLGRDLGGVRLHTGPDAADAARGLNAYAFTTGHDIYFDAGQYRPGTPAGDRLLAHELVHVAQQERLAPAVQRDEKPAATANDNIQHPPRVGVSVSMGGMMFAPGEGVTYNAGPKAPQAMAMALGYLADENYSPTLTKEALATAPWIGRGSLKGNAKKDEPVEQFGFELVEAMALVLWLENKKKIRVALARSQRQLLIYGWASASAWKELKRRATEINLDLPAWYTGDLFAYEMSSHIELVTRYIAASTEYEKTKDPGALKELLAVLTDISIEIDLPAFALEQIRADAQLIDHFVYRLLWPSASKSTDKTKLPPPKLAPPKRPPDPLVAGNLLAYMRTQQPLVADALQHTASRRELLDRFGRFLDRTFIASVAKGDQKVTAQPATANTAPFPFTMSVYPALSGPALFAFEASLDSSYHFTMQIQFPDVFAAFQTIYYEWNYVRVPDDKIGKPVTYEEIAAETGAKTPSYGDVAKHKFARAVQYTGEDFKTIINDLGPVGVAAAGLVEANAILRFVGTGIRLFLGALTRPASETEIVFPEPGLYLVRCKAVPDTGKEAEIQRAPSVAYQPVVIKRPQDIVESRLKEQTEGAQGTKDRIAELKDNLAKKPNDPAADDWRKELGLLELSAQGVQGALAAQRKQLVELRDTKKDQLTKQELAAIESQIQDIDLQLEVRFKRSQDYDLTKAERILGSFISDEGQSLGLLLEAVKLPDSEGKVRYWVSDLTTKNSGQDTGEGSDRAAAILAAVESILKGHAGYGRGYVSIYVDTKQYTRRITASVGALLNEALENISLALTLAALVAAPFTGGASLVLLIPAGFIGLVPSVYRLVNRALDNTLRLDFQSVMDVLNIVTAAIGGASVVAKALKFAWIGRALYVAGIGGHVANILMIPAGVIIQMEELEGLPEGVRAARMLEILGNALIAAGAVVGGEILKRAQNFPGRKEPTAEETNKAPAIEQTREPPLSADEQNRAYKRWEEELPKDSRDFVDQNPAVREAYGSVDPETRGVLTACASICIIPCLTRALAGQYRAFLVRLKQIGGVARLPVSWSTRLQILAHISGTSADEFNIMLRRLNNMIEGLQDRQSRGENINVGDELDRRLVGMLRQRGIQPKGAFTPGDRNAPGAATGGTQLPLASEVAGQLRDTLGRYALIARQVAARIRALGTFTDFNDMTGHIWQEMARFPEIVDRFNAIHPDNGQRMANGQAPYGVGPSELVGLSDGQRNALTYQLHHIQQIQFGGGVYDLGNLIVINPYLHRIVHSSAVLGTAPLSP